EAPDEADFLGTGAETVEKLALLLLGLRDERERTVFLSTLDTLIQLEDERIDHWRRLLGESATVGDILTSAKTALSWHQQVLAVYAQARAIMKEADTTKIPEQIRKEVALSLLQTSKTAVDNALRLQRFVNEFRPLLSLS